MKERKGKEPELNGTVTASKKVKIEPPIDLYNEADEYSDGSNDGQGCSKQPPGMKIESLPNGQSYRETRSIFDYLGVPAFPKKPNNLGGDDDISDLESEPEEEQRARMTVSPSKYEPAPSSEDDGEESDGSELPDTVLDLENGLSGDSDEDDDDDEEEERAAKDKQSTSNLNGLTAENMKTPVAIKKAMFRDPPVSDVRTIGENGDGETPSLIDSHLRKFANLTPALSRIKYEDPDDTGDYTYYLVQKPKEISLDDLNQLKLKADPEQLNVKKLKVKNEAGKFNAELSSYGPQQLIARRTAKRNTHGDVRWRIRGQIMGTILLKPREEPTNIGPLTGEEFDVDLPLTKIKRVATRDEFDELAERAVPFGVKKKKRNSLPGHAVKLKKIKMEH
ncbi:unnamed protein product, partial [Mesorhabditis spiculigera]